MKATLIYDGACPLCCAARDWIEGHALPGEFEYVACQSEDRARRFPQVGEERCLEAMQLVFADGRVFAGDAALPQICRALRRWRCLARVLDLPPVSLISPAAYRFIAKRRRTFSVLVAHKAPESCPVKK
jgi:predicted DCC family thiol-disulfide oxidoreductase YuxK